MNVVDRNELLRQYAWAWRKASLKQRADFLIEHRREIEHFLADQLAKSRANGQAHTTSSPTA